jgi:hypothetical protein
MNPSTLARLESELAEIFRNTPTGLTSNAQLAPPKKPAAWNAMTHGLTAQNIILTAEELPLYAKMGLDFMRACKPVGVREIGNAQLMFEGRWRLHRILAIESDLLVVSPPREDDPVVRSRSQNRGRQVNAFREEARNIELISRYETRIVRNGARLNAELKELQRDRAGQTPDLGFDQPSDESNNEAIAWYMRLVAVSETLAKAKQEYEDYEAAQRAAAEENTNAAETEQTQTAAASTSPSDSFRKMRPRLTAPIAPDASVGAKQWRPFTDESTWGPDKVAA